MRVSTVAPRRLFTCFTFLKDVAEDGGGRTIFPRLSNLTVRPLRGRAVVFSNVNADGWPDLDAVHKASPLTKKGSFKYGMNVWITDTDTKRLRGDG